MPLLSLNSLRLRSSLMALAILVTMAVPTMSADADSRSVRSDRIGGEATAASQAEVKPAADTNRRRPARVNRDESASLSGRVLEAGSNAPVSEAVIIVQGRTITANAQGMFTITKLAAGTTTVRIERWGFEAATRNLNLVEGTNALGDVTLTPGPVVMLTETNGTTHRLDLASVEFASAAPLSSYVPVSPGQFCRLDGTVSQYDKSQIALVTGPGVQATGACCPAESPGMQVTLTLKSGETFPVIMQVCRFYKYDFIGRNRDTGQWIYRDFSMITRIQFP